MDGTDEHLRHACYLAQGLPGTRDDPLLQFSRSPVGERESNDVLRGQRIRAPRSQQMDHAACNDLGLTRAGTSYQLKVFAVVLNRAALGVG